MKKYECKYPSHLQDYLDAGEFNEEWSRTLRNYFLDKVIASHVGGLKVIETGSRSGVFTYAACYHGAKEALGIEIRPEFAKKSNKLLKNISNNCKVICGDTRLFDHSSFDMALCLGLLYNSHDEDKEIILQQVSKCKVVLAEFWSKNNSNPNPVSEQVDHDNGTTQWLPNNAMAEKMLSSYFYHVEDITPKSHLGVDLQNRYYMCRQKEALFF